MKIKSKKSSRSKIKVGSAITILLVLSIATAMLVAQMHWRVLTVEGSRTSSPPHTVAAASRRAQEKEEDGSPPPPRRRPPSSREELPAIGREGWRRAYSSAYAGLLPPSAREEAPDPSCGRRPDFFDFFALPKSER